jgi:molecular chaperone GrpE
MASETDMDELVRRELSLAGETASDEDGSEPPPEVDLRTVLGELARVRAELRAETESTRQLRDAVTQTDARAEERRALEQQATAGKRAMEALVDMGDRLETSLAAAEQACRREERPSLGRLLRRGRGTEAVRSLRDGLQLTLRRLKEHLAEAELQRVPTVGHAFDPETMEAIETVRRPDLGEGVVAEEVASGYRQAGKLMRAAKVIVNRTGES